MACKVVSIIILKSAIGVDPGKSGSFPGTQMLKMRASGGFPVACFSHRLGSEGMYPIFSGATELCWPQNNKIHTYLETFCKKALGPIAF